MTPTTATAACRCPLCHDLLGRAVQRRLVRCKTCRTPYHRHCWDELGGCSTLGCTNRRRRRRPEPEPAEQQVTTATEPAPPRGRPLPTFNLDDIRVASPCPADWNAMEGDDRVRHCGTCDKQVFDLSALPRAKAIALLTDEGVPPCARFYRRRDGRVITSDCWAGRLIALRRRLRERRGVLAAIAVAVVAGAILLSKLFGGGVYSHTQGGISYDMSEDAQVRRSVRDARRKTWVLEQHMTPDERMAYRDARDAARLVQLRADLGLHPVGP